MSGNLLSAAIVNVCVHLCKLLCHPDFIEVLADPFEAFSVQIVKAMVECDGENLRYAVNTARARLMWGEREKER